MPVRSARSFVKHITCVGAMALTLSCSSGSSTGPVTTGGGTFRATIDGASWVSTTSTVTASANGAYTLTGYQLSNAVSLSMTLWNIGATGTYPIGVGPTVPGGTAIVVSGGASFNTPLSGAAGTVTVSTLSTTRIAGTFNFSAPPVIGQSGSSKVVTSGSFDLPMSGVSSVSINDNVGSKFTGTVAGNAFTAATIVSVTPVSSGTLTLGASNTAYNVTLILSGYTGAGTYALGSGASRTMQVTIPGSATQSWGSTNATSSGTVVITSATATRIKGTINATLSASPGFSGSPVSVVGTFDYGVP